MTTQPPPPAPTAERKKKKTWPWIMALVVLVPLGLAGGCVALLAAAGTSLSTTIEGDKQTAIDAADVACSFGEGRVEATVEVTSPFDEARDVVSYDVALLDADGANLGTILVPFQNLNPGQEASASRIGSAPDGADRCEISDASVSLN